VVFVLSPASWAYANLGRWKEAETHGFHALRLAEELQDDSSISFTAWVISVAFIQKGDLPRALEYAELSVDRATTIADKGWAKSRLAWIWCRAGEPSKGIETLESLAETIEATSSRMYHLWRALWLGEGLWLAGEYGKAKHTLEDVLRIAEPCGTRFHIGSACRLLGELALNSNTDEALPHFERSITVLREIKAENELALAYAGLGRLHKQEGNTAKAKEYLMNALEIFERLGTLIEPDKVKKELAELPNG
jgi:tetratricopeptide (TPR) repeat protein